MLIAAVVLLVVAVAVLVALALVKANPSDFEDEMERAEAEGADARIELEGLPSHSPPSSGGAHAHSPNVHGDAPHQDLPRLG